MKKVALISLIACFGQSSRGSLSAGITVPDTVGLKPIPFAKDIALNDRTRWHGGGPELLRVKPNVGGDRLPAALIIQVSRPRMGYTKFELGRLIFPVDEFDKTLFNGAVYANPKSTERPSDGHSQLHYGEEGLLR